MRRNLKIESRDDVRSRISSTGPINTLSVIVAQALSGINEMPSRQRSPRAERVSPARHSG